MFFNTFYLYIIKKYIIFAMLKIKIKTNMLDFLRNLLNKFKTKMEEEDQSPNADYFVNENKYDEIRNHFGKVISYKTRYEICKRIIFCSDYIGETLNYHLVIHNHDTTNDTYIVEWVRINRGGFYMGHEPSWFNTKEEADKTLQDMLNNPDKYILK